MNEIILLEDLGMIYPNESSKDKKRYGLYKCFCGNEFKSRMDHIRIGKTKSCKCVRDKVRLENITTHNLSKHRLYKTWIGMIKRCTDKKSSSYKNYGARGITVCDRWLSVKNFIEDMNDAFQEGLSLDRINPNGNYEPSNCRWASREIQNRNTRAIRTTNKSNYRGVSWHKNRKNFRSTICVNNKQIHLGCFDTALEAAKIYDKYVIDNNLEHTTNGVYTKD